MKKIAISIVTGILTAVCSAEDIFWDRLQHTESTEAALELCDTELQRKPADYYVYFYRAMIKRESGDLEGALLDFNQALELEPAFSGAYVGRADVKKKMGDAKGAEADLAKSKTVDHILDGLSAHIDTNKKDAKAYLDRAMHKRFKQPPDLRGSTEDFETYLALVEEDTNQLPYLYLANDYNNMGLPYKAIDTLTKGIVLFPSFGKFYQRRLAIRKQVGDEEGVWEDEQNLEELAKANARETIANQTKVLKENPDNIYALTTRAEYYIKLNELDAAQSDIAHALSIDPESRSAKRVQRDIDRERNKE